MADNQSQLPSSVAPSDSVSSTGNGKKSKPGKAERLARRSAVGSQPGQSASAAKAAVFSSGVSAPKPTPGKFPVVFQTGAGEPSKDQGFVLDERVLQRTLSGFPSRFTYNARYAEFKAHAEIDDQRFEKDLVTSALLRLAQQLVHSHVNMSLPQGDFSAVASTDVRVPGSVSAFLSQYGEYSVPALGTRFLLSGYEQSVKAVVHAAHQVDKTGQWSSLERLWLPMSAGDPHTKATIASRLNDFLAPMEVGIDATALEEAVLSGDVPDVWENIKDFLGDIPDDPGEGQPRPVDPRDRFDFLFKSYSTAPLFVTAFTNAANSSACNEIGLTWTTPSAGHLDWSFNAKEAFTRLADKWAKKSATYAQFFELSSGVANRSAACGSQAQMAVVSTVDSVTIVKAALALSAGEFSLVACFPASGVFSGELKRRVVVTTPLSVSQRATEFVQMDWRS